MLYYGLRLRVRVWVSVMALYLGSRVLYDVEAWSPRILIYRTLPGRYIMELHEDRKCSMVRAPITYASPEF